MRKLFLSSLLGLVLMSCSEHQHENISNTKHKESPSLNLMEKAIDTNLPTIGILIFEGVIINEVVAPLDVFSNSNKEGQTLFNVITIGKAQMAYQSAHGLKINPDYTIDHHPELEVLVVPSSYHPEQQTSDKALLDFIQEQNKSTQYIASHCAGAFLIGASGIADNKEIVTYVGGGDFLQKDYPNLKVADDSKIAVVEDGKFISSNGSLVSYIASFDLLEKMTDKSHRNYVEAAILFDRIKE